MKITISQLISTLNIEKELLPQKLPIRTAYNLSKIFARAREELEFYQERFKEIVTQYGEKDENGNLIFLENENVSIPKDKIEKCQKEIPDYSISLDSLEAIKISLDEISVLLPFICEK